MTDFEGIASSMDILRNLHFLCDLLDEIYDLFSDLSGLIDERYDLFTDLFESPTSSMSTTISASMTSSTASGPLDLVHG